MTIQLNNRTTGAILCITFILSLAVMLNDTIANPHGSMPVGLPVVNSIPSGAALAAETENNTSPCSGKRSCAAMVKRVVDGDTIELENGEKVRYIGVDTPESVKPGEKIECFGKEAAEKNKELVQGKEVRLEMDTSDKDRYGRLLRYVYVGDTFVNEYLVSNGYANAASYAPNVSKQKQLRQAEKQAREQQKGFWAADACVNQQGQEPGSSLPDEKPTVKGDQESNPASDGSLQDETSAAARQPWERTANTVAFWVVFTLVLAITLYKRFKRLVG